MSLRGFVRVLFRSDSAQRRPRHSGDELATEIRETIGTLGGGAGGGSGRMTGRSVYRHLEDRDRN